MNAIFRQTENPHWLSAWRWATHPKNRKVSWDQFVVQVDPKYVKRPTSGCFREMTTSDMDRIDGPHFLFNIQLTLARWGSRAYMATCGGLGVCDIARLKMDHMISHVKTQVPTRAITFHGAFGQEVRILKGPPPERFTWFSKMYAAVPEASCWCHAWSRIVCLRLLVTFPFTLLVLDDCQASFRSNFRILKFAGKSW